MTARPFGLLVLALALLLAGCSRPSTEEKSSTLSDASPETRGVEPYMSEDVREAFRRSCASCHGYDGHGILGVAPDLRRAKRRTPEEWEKYLRDSSGSHPAGQAPPLWVTGDELTALAAWLDQFSASRP